jgi:hypothetical protein
MFFIKVKFFAKFISTFSLNGVIKARRICFPIFILIAVNGTSIGRNKMFNNLFISRGYVKRISKFIPIFRDMETTIPIGISAKINHVFFEVHHDNDKIFKLLKQQFSDNPTEITRADVDNVVATLQNNDADFMTNMIGGEDKFGTGPIRDAYFGLCDTRMIGQLENANGFINKAQYPNQTGVMSSEWGSIGNIRFYLSSRGSVTVGASLLGADIYNLFIGGQEAYAKIEQNGVSAKFIYHPPGHGDDPAELRQTAAWRMAQVPRITNDAWIISLRCTLA